MTWDEGWSCVECGQQISFGDRVIPVHSVPMLHDMTFEGYLHLYHLAQNPS